MRACVRWRWLSALVVFVAVASYGCSDDPQTQPTNDTAPDDTSTQLTDSTTFVDIACPADEPSVDHDDDGLASGIEDANQNCVVDDGETDPRRADTDGDGLLDGDEDINRNGLVDNGETDPRELDTDGDGVLDGDEATALVCVPELLDRVSARPLPKLDATLALPSSVALTAIDADSPAALLDDPVHGIYGFVTAFEMSKSLSELAASQRFALAEKGHRAGVLAMREFPTWSLEDGVEPALLPRQAIETALELSYGPGGYNPDGTAKTPGEVRRELLNVLTAISADPGPTKPPCESVRVRHLLIKRSATQALLLVLAACAEQVEEDAATRTLLDDLASATSIAPASVRPDGYRCTELASPTARPVDVLVVVDNSSSMDDDQDAVETSIDALIARLDAAGVDWRVAVTTTEAYLLATESTRLDDPLMDTCSGLRGDGFVSNAAPDAGARVRELALTEPGCEANVEKPGANLCGDDAESGLESTATVLERIADRAGDDPICGEAHAWRAGSARLVLWLSDEEDTAILGTNGAPLPNDDPVRVEVLQRVSDKLAQASATACAIVGDSGTGSSGVCPSADFPTTDEPTNTAQHGAGYVSVANRRGGSISSICASEHASGIQRCLRPVLADAAGTTLDGPPISRTLSVSSGGEVRLRGPLAGWEYAPGANAVFVNGDGSTARAAAYATWVRAFE